MAFLGNLLQEFVKQRKTVHKRKKLNPYFEQQQVLYKLLLKAKNTLFGKTYDFENIAYSDDIISTFQSIVPVFDYQKMYKEWWYRALLDNENICWPKRIKYFALTSGTSEAASKRVPVSDDMIKCIRRTSKRQMVMNIPDLNLKPDFFQKCILMLGGCTNLNKVGKHFEGDLSGILASKLPLWFQKFYKPGKKISSIKDWNQKLDAIVLNAPNWDIAAIAGVPAWIQLLFEKIINHYKIKSIHDIWPDFKILVHGGVSFEPYKHSFNHLLSKEIYTLETYLASEGFFAFQTDINKNSMQLVLNNGIFFEFIPFNEDNFDSDGNLKSNAKALNIKEVENNVNYALLITSCAGAWRYLLGDTIKFVNKDLAEIVITGRTKHFLSLCGEHLSVDNMNEAIKRISQIFNIDINEFNVAGIKYGKFFAHKWYLGVNGKIDDNKKNEIRKALDDELKKLNDDYATERTGALKNIFVEILPVKIFYDWLEKKGKLGAQNKFPRVLKTEQLADWESFVMQNKNL